MTVDKAAANNTQGGLTITRAAYDRARVRAAAPDLLTACEQALGYLESRGLARDIRSMLSDAIAKAKGGAA